MEEDEVVLIVDVLTEVTGAVEVVEEFVVTMEVTDEEGVSETGECVEDASFVEELGCACSDSASLDTSFVLLRPHSRFPSFSPAVINSGAEQILPGK